MCCFTTMLLVLGLAACDEQESYEQEEVAWEEDVAPFDQEAYSEEYIEEVPFDGEDEYVYEENIYDENDFFEDESYREPPLPELAIVPPVGDVIADAEWEEITDGVSFDRTKKKKPKEPPSFNPGIDFGKGFEAGLSTIAWVLVVALIIGLLAWLIVRTKVDTSVETVRDFSMTDELLASSKKELADALTQNLTRKDYRAAIRYRFGQLLQAMRKEGLLVWVPGRTNAEYQRNLQSPFFESFGVLAKAFSYALYSGKNITETHYETFAKEADDFLALIVQPRVNAGLSPKPTAR